MLNEARFLQNCAASGIVLEKDAAAQFAEYADFLCEYNAHTNLTAITEPQDIENKHFIDSLIFAAQPEVRGSLLDVGSGAGFPGVPAKIVCPALSLALLESNGKKARFLQQLAARLGLEAQILHMRAEDAAHMAEYRERFDTVTARAVAQMNVLCEYCLPFVRPGGYFIAMKSSAAAGEIGQAAAAIETLGGALAAQREYTLPDGVRRTLVLVQKRSATPQKYPRNPAAIKKRAL